MVFYSGTPDIWAKYMYKNLPGVYHTDKFENWGKKEHDQYLTNQGYREITPLEEALLNRKILNLLEETKRKWGEADE